MPFKRPSGAMEVCHETPLASTIRSWQDFLESTLQQAHSLDGNLTPAEADLPCKAIDEDLLRSALVVLVGIHQEPADRLQVKLILDMCAHL